VVIFQFLGFLAEAFIFAYLGLTFFSYQTFMWSSDLIFIEAAIILIGRCLGTFGLIGFMKLFGYEKHNKKRITMRELLFIWYAGLIRGAIAFGLVLRIESSVPNRSVIVTTSLTLVVVSTIFFGSTVGLLGKCLFPGKEEEPAQEVPDEEVSNSLSSKESELKERLVHYNEQDD